jgi:hypothetical protein
MKKTDDPDYFRTYYKENKEKIRKNIYKKKQCECGAIVLACNIYKHRKSKKHTDNLNFINSVESPQD